MQQIPNDLTEFLAYHQAQTRDLQKRTAQALIDMMRISSAIQETLKAHNTQMARLQQLEARLDAQAARLTPPPALPIAPRRPRKWWWVAVLVAASLVGVIALLTFGR